MKQPRETLEEKVLNILEENGKAKENVLWAGGNDFQIPLADFWEYAAKNGFDWGDSVLDDLHLEGEDFMVCFGEYDGFPYLVYFSFLKGKETRKLCSLRRFSAYPDDNTLQNRWEYENGIMNEYGEYWDDLI